LKERPGEPAERAGSREVRRILDAGPYRNRFYFQNPLHRANIERALEALGDLSSKTVLDYGCGARVLTTAILARSSNRVVALDADLDALRLLRSRLPADARGKVLVVAADGHAPALRDGGVDAVFGLGVLHHLDLARSLEALDRILKPGARAAFVEPLGHNPAVNLFRRLTPRMRDPEEHPLRIEDFSGIEALFDDVRHEESQLVSLGALALRGIPLAGERLFRLTLPALVSLDGWILSWMPFLRKYAWTTVVTFRRRSGPTAPVSRPGRAWRRPPRHPVHR
jgi:SAM-dependent methyltransferase